MSLVVIGAGNPISQKFMAQAREDERAVLAVYHQTVPKAYQDGVSVAVDITNAKDVAAVVKPGDTVIMFLSETPNTSAVSITERLHAVLAAVLGRDIRLVLLDRFLPEIADAIVDHSHAVPANDDRLRPFFWADDLRNFAEKKGASVSILRSGPVYGSESGVFLDAAFWRQILRGGAVSTSVMPDQKLNLVALDDVARALYLVATEPPAEKGTVEELHMPSDRDISVSEMAALGANVAGTQAFVRQAQPALYRFLSLFTARQKPTAPPEVLCGRANPELVRAFSKRLALVQSSHTDSVRKIISDAGKSAG